MNPQLYIIWIAAFRPKLDSETGGIAGFDWFYDPITAKEASLAEENDEHAIMPLALPFPPQDYPDEVTSLIDSIFDTLLDCFIKEEGK